MARERFCGRIPEGLLYDPHYDMWVRRATPREAADHAAGEDNAQLVVVGASSLGLHRAGEIIAFTAKPRGAQVECGRGLGTVECAKTVLAVHAPLALTLLTGNEAVEERPALLHKDPYGAGWMVFGRAHDWARDSALLLDAAGYRAQVLAQEPDALITP